jgi:hypothetical protein
MKKYYKITEIRKDEDRKDKNRRMRTAKVRRRGGR